MKTISKTKVNKTATRDFKDDIEEIARQSFQPKPYNHSDKILLGILIYGAVVVSLIFFVESLIK